MKIVPIVTRSIAPASPKPGSDSERTSWSSASVVSTIYTKSPEPKLPEPKLPEVVPQKLLQPIPVSSVKKKVIIVVTIGCAVLIVVGVILASILPHAFNKPSPATTLSTTATISTTTTLAQ